MMAADDLNTLWWRKSSFSDQNGMCVEVAPTPDDRIAMRDSKAPDAGALYVSRPGMAAYLRGVKAGQFDTRT
jgi:Domain of unknown function (DUF397)